MRTLVVVLTLICCYAASWRITKLQGTADVVQRVTKPVYLGDNIWSFVSEETILKVPAQVIGWLHPNFVRVTVLSGYGMADGGIPTDVPSELVPHDLRMPNSKFLLALDRSTRRFVGVVRIDPSD